MTDAPDPAEREQPSQKVVDQRVRNRVIEHLELVSSPQRQADYARNAPPFVNVPYEIINQWQDWVPLDPRSDPNLDDVYSPAEIQALGNYHAAWDRAVRAVPDSFPTLDEVRNLPEWGQMTDTAAAAASCFADRGKLPEDHEVL